MKENNPISPKTTAQTTLLVGLDVSFLVLSYVAVVWYMTYQGGGDTFPRNETPGMYHLVGIAIFLTIMTSLFVALGIFCVVRLKNLLKLIPIFSTFLCLLPLLIFAYEIYRWS